MEILKQRIHGSPYVGIFSSVTEKIGLFPRDLPNDQEKKISETLGIEIVKTSLANCSLIGVLAVGNSNGFIVSEIVEDYELGELEKLGIKVKKLKSIAAVGNLIEVNDSRGLCSSVFPKDLMKEIEKFLKIELINAQIAKSDLIGSCLIASNKGFLMNPNASNQDFNLVKKYLNLNGSIGTANYGDNFVGNSVLANGNGAIVGEQTTGFEMIRIDEGLKGD